jgi:hypothetical protein
MIQLVVALVLLVTLVAGVVWVIVRELTKGSERKRRLTARWEAELRQDVATNPRFWSSKPVVGKNAASAGRSAEDSALRKTP